MLRDELLTACVISVMSIVSVFFLSFWIRNLTRAFAFCVELDIAKDIATFNNTSLDAAAVVSRAGFDTLRPTCLSSSSSYLPGTDQQRHVTGSVTSSPATLATVASNAATTQFARYDKNMNVQPPRAAHCKHSYISSSALTVLINTVVIIVVLW